MENFLEIAGSTHIERIHTNDCDDENRLFFTSRVQLLDFIYQFAINDEKIHKSAFLHLESICPTVTYGFRFKTDVYA